MAAGLLAAVAVLALFTAIVPAAVKHDDQFTWLRVVGILVAFIPFAAVVWQFGRRRKHLQPGVRVDAVGLTIVGDNEEHLLRWDTIESIRASGTFGIETLFSGPNGAALAILPYSLADRLTKKGTDETTLADLIVTNTERFVKEGRYRALALRTRKPDEVGIQGSQPRSAPSMATIVFAVLVALGIVGALLFLGFR